MVRSCLLLAVLFWLVPFSGPLQAQQSKESITIYYTASLNGNLDGCDCKGLPRSGLVKTGYFLAGRDRDRSVLLEAGDFLDVRPDDLLSGYIFDSFRELDYTVLGLGDQEFSGGLEQAVAYRDENPLLCNNLSVKVGDVLRSYSPGPLMLSRLGVKIGIFSLIDPEVFYFYPESVKNGIRVDSPVQTAASLVEELVGAGTDLIIGIYHGSVTAAEELAGTVKGIDILLVGHEQRLVEAELIGDTIIVSPGENGSRVGILSIDVKRGKIIGYENSFRSFHYLTSPDLPSIRQRIQNYYQELVGRLRGNDQ